MALTAVPGGDEVAERLADVRRRIGRAGGDPDGICIVAVTKGFGPEAVTAALDAGIDDLGENYAQELLAKAAPSPGAAGSGAAGSVAIDPSAAAAATGADLRGLRWHFLGAPQRNKMAALAPVVTLWQGMDRAPVVDRLARLRPGAAALVQVNMAGDPAKAGCAVADTGPLVERARQAGLHVRGLMCVAPAGDADAARHCFAALRDLALSLQVGELSMGMSDDFEAAVAEGSTMVRLGRVLFGPRPGRAGVRR